MKNLHEKSQVSKIIDFVIIFIDYIWDFNKAFYDLPKELKNANIDWYKLIAICVLTGMFLFVVLYRLLVMAWGGFR